MVRLYSRSKRRVSRRTRRTKGIAKITKRATKRRTRRTIKRTKRSTKRRTRRTIKRTKKTNRGGSQISTAGSNPSLERERIGKEEAASDNIGDIIAEANPKFIVGDGRRALGPVGREYDELWALADDGKPEAVWPAWPTQLTPDTLKAVVVATRAALIGNRRRISQQTPNIHDSNILDVGHVSLEQDMLRYKMRQAQKKAGIFELFERARLGSEPITILENYVVYEAKKAGE